jgi:hypothetical protein
LSHSSPLVTHVALTVPHVSGSSRERERGVPFSPFSRRVGSATTTITSVAFGFHMPFILKPNNPHENRQILQSPT